MKKLTQKIKGLKKTTKVDFATYLGVVLAFAAVTLLGRLGLLNRFLTGMLVPICAYIVMAVSLNLTVGILGERACAAPAGGLSGHRDLGLWRDYQGTH